MPHSVSGEDSFFSSATETTELRLKLLAAGYDPVPATGKRPLLKDWQKIEVSPEVIRGWEADTRLTNPGIIDLVMIEVQSGEYLGEDDIVRFDDIYGRAPADAKK